MTKLTKLRILLILFSLLPSICISQPEDFHEVKGLPTKEIYDLLVDKRGFLWIAHNLGVSRYDGVNFTHFSNPEENSLGMTDLIEDGSGRIWCHNFSSQVFYIENEKMNLLTEYNSKEETFLPRMAMLDSILYVTSMKGLFTYNTYNKKANYYLTDFDTTRSYLGHREHIFNLSVLKDKILLNGFGRWFQFDPHKKKIQKLLPKSEDVNNIIKRDIHLQPTGNGDTAYAILNEKTLFLKINIHKDSVYISDSIKCNEFINTITWSGSDYWLNCRSRSSTINRSEEIQNANISDLVVDKEGNTWCSSFEYGLIIRYKNYWKKITSLLLDKDDFIRQASEGNRCYVYGTQKGKIIIVDSITQNKVSELKLPSNSGAVEFIKYIGSSRFLISGSLYSYILELNHKAINLLTKNVIIKDAIEADSGYYLATNQGVQFLTINKTDLYSLRMLYRRRCFQIAYNSQKKELLAAFADGLYQVKNEEIAPVLFNDKQIYASNIYFLNGKFYFTSLDGSLFIKKDSSIKLIQPKKTRISNVLSIKGFGDHLWFIRPFYIRAYDTKLDKPIVEFLIPQLIDQKIYDLMELNSSLIAFTSNGQYQIKLKQSHPVILKGYLTKISINNKDTVISNHLTLSYYQGNIDFHISAPYFTNPEQVYFKYRLIGSSNEDWDTTENFQRVISYASLQPGKYKFEAIAINPQTNTIAEPLLFEFEILPPWYSTVWFKLLVILFAGLLAYGIYYSRKTHHRTIEKLQNNITADLHDDIGATLSSINIYAEIAKNEPSRSIIETIQTNTRYAISSLDEMVWNLNKKKETIEHLTERMESFATSLLSFKKIKCDVQKHIHDPQFCPYYEKTRHIYFMFKELVNNLAKHSQADNCIIKVIQDEQYFCFVIKDNGIGFDIATTESIGNGITNLKQRAKESGGKLSLISSPGKGTIAEFTLPIENI